MSNASQWIKDAAAELAPLCYTLAANGRMEVSMRGIEAIVAKHHAASIPPGAKHHAASIPPGALALALAARITEIGWKEFQIECSRDERDTRKCERMIAAELAPLSAERETLRGMLLESICGFQKILWSTQHEHERELCREKIARIDAVLNPTKGGV